MSDKFTHPYNDETGRWEKVAELYAGGYSWDIACVWRDTTTGRLYGDTDSGCSCYGPFEEEGYGASEYAEGDLTEITSRDQATTMAESAHGEDGVSTTERLDFVREVEVSLAKVGSPT
jgi:hypothetical protein